MKLAIREEYSADYFINDYDVLMQFAKLCSY